MLIVNSIILVYNVNKLNLLFTWEISVTFYGTSPLSTPLKWAHQYIYTLKTVNRQNSSLDHTKARFWWSLLFRRRFYKSFERNQCCVVLAWKPPFSWRSIKNKRSQCVFIRKLLRISTSWKQFFGTYSVRIYAPIKSAPK